MIDFDELDELEAALEQAQLVSESCPAGKQVTDGDGNGCGARLSYTNSGYSIPRSISERPPRKQDRTFMETQLQRDPPVYRDRQDFDAWQGRVLPGDATGVRLMHTLPLLQQAGPEWLTAAFHAAGTLPLDNQVVAINELTPFEGGGAGLKAVLVVEYARSQPDLHTQLFVKLPHEQDQNHKYLIDAILNQNKPEVDFARLLAHKMPFRVPKMYFADHCARTSNFVLITEKVPFDVDGFEAAHDKYMDHKLPRPAHEYYFVLMRQLGRMVAAYKSGRLGRGLEASFPTESAVVATGGHPSMMKAKVASMLKFAGEVAPQLMPRDVADHPTFLASDAQTQIMHTSLYYQEMVDRMTANPDYVAYAHPNLNVDNAWWWADPDSKQLDCGVLDWGGFKSRPVAMHLQLSLFAGGCDLLDAHGDGLLATFVDECAKEGGPELCLEELKLQYALALIGSVAGSSGTVGTIFRHTPRGEW
eukprot:CAMPEP_0114261368 /NCGR_PEP_ID=MMETSP0058-20121206/21086_1 /TAXON_ID=36894 /ORGANISM="Pyramimonas parkeae, CCMP726" /LENGTH=473 /DNA_ID=CAMNT_0001376871 /DNA_START=122 /DNA_END=1541 /DNA_ORIENTATION=+